jgi:hypothetical protein
MNITEDNKRWPERISIDFYVNEDHQYFMIDGNDKIHLDPLTDDEIGKLVIKTINECI